jgi:glycerophosphoryl diester phosphodiesterase
VPRLADVLEWAKASGARLNIELNYYPTEPAASTTPNFIADVLDTIDASGVPKDRILIQSFLPDNLEPAKARGYKTALITFQVAESSAVATASDRGFDVIEPQWPLKDPKGFLKSAHAAGKRVIPFTLDARTDLVGAKRAGMDGAITDDAPLARAVVRCEDARAALKRASKRLKAAKAAARRARTRSGSARQQRAAARRVRAAKRRVAKARGAMKSACA